MVAVPLLAAVSFALAAVARHPLDGFLGLAVDLAGIGAGLALGDVFTVTWPYPMVKKPGNPTRGAADGYLGSAFAGMIGTLAGVAVAVAPVILAAVFTGSVPAGVRMPVLVVAAGGYGFVLARTGAAIAARRAEPKLPELYQVAVRSQL